MKMYDTYYTYPETYSRSRPFFLEFKRFEKNGFLSFQLFQAMYIYSERAYKIFLEELSKGLIKPEQKELMAKIYSPEGHPWNLFEGRVLEEDVVALATESMLKFMVDAMNDKYEKEYIPN